MRLIKYTTYLDNEIERTIELVIYMRNGARIRLSFSYFSPKD